MINRHKRRPRPLIKPKTANRRPLNMKVLKIQRGLPRQTNFSGLTLMRRHRLINGFNSSPRIVNGGGRKRASTVTRLTRRVRGHHLRHRV